eukprot:2158242-Rhodomonas_salina.1
MQNCLLPTTLVTFHSLSVRPRFLFVPSQPGRQGWGVSSDSEGGERGRRGGGGGRLAIEGGE